MRKVLFAGLLLLATFTVMPAVHAQSSNTSDTNNIYNPATGDFNTGQLQQQTQQLEQQPNVNQSIDNETQANLQQQSTQLQQQAVQSSPSATNAGTTGANASGGTTSQGNTNDPDAVFGIILGPILQLFAWLAGAAGVLLNDAVFYTIVQMGSFVKNLTAVGVTWGVLRNIGNLVLIFGFLATGISTIIGYDSYGVAKRLPLLLVMAVLLNFSLFIAEAIVDVGNIFATEFYTQINNGQTPTVLGLGGVGSQTTGGISNAIMNSLGLATLYNVSGQSQLGVNNSGNFIPQTQTTANSAQVTNWKAMLIGFLGIILFVVAAFVMFSLAFVLVARLVALVLLIIVAPVGFAGLLVPGLDKYAGQWWKNLFNQTLLAPALLLMLYIALAVITDANFLTGIGSASTGVNWYQAADAGSATGNTLGLAGLLLSFCVAMGLLFACVILAKSMSKFGANAATSLGGKLSFGLTAGAMGFVGRRTVGKASNFASRKLRESGFDQSEFGRLILKGTDFGAKGSFDLRGSKTVASGLKAAGIDAGTASKTSYRKIQEDATKERIDHAKSLKGNQTAYQEKELKDSEEFLKKTTEKREENKKNRDATEKEVADLTEKRDGLNLMDPEHEKVQKQIDETQKRLVAQNEALATSENVLREATERRTKIEKETEGTFTTKQAKENYVKDLAKVNGYFKGGTYLNALGFGSAVGAGHGIPVGIGLGAVAGGWAGGGAGLSGGAAYLYSAAVQANKEAREAILRDINKSAVEKATETLRAAIEKETKKKPEEEETH